MSNAKEPAFPVKRKNAVVIDGRLISDSGLSKREYFAATAMQGLLPNYRTERSQDGDEALAYLAVKQADALLAELAKPVSEPKESYEPRYSAANRSR